ncbi:MAG: glycosyltransferase family 2 protein, partial [Patescibacteria group bacterium]
MQKIDVSIIIVSFNTKDLLRACLAAVAAGEVIVVDNGSSDGSVEMVKKEFPGVTLIANSQNRGFAAANNQGLKRSHGRYLLLLNSDTEVPQGSVEEVTRFMDEHPDIGVVGAKLMLPNG